MKLFSKSLSSLLSSFLAMDGTLKIGLQLVPLFLLLSANKTSPSRNLGENPSKCKQNLFIEKNLGENLTFGNKFKGLRGSLLSAWYESPHFYQSWQ